MGKNDKRLKIIKLSCAFFIYFSSALIFYNLFMLITTVELKELSIHIKTSRRKLK